MTPIRTLVLMRHAKAEQHATGGDEMRPLSLAGRKQASRAGLALLQAGIEPEVVLVSPAIRTRQTADLAVTSLGRRGDIDLVFADPLYHGYVTELLDELAQVDERVRSVLVVGHEPTMSATAVRLADGDGVSDPAALHSVNRGMRTASCAVFEVHRPWDELAYLGAGLRELIETPLEN